MGKKGIPLSYSPVLCKKIKLYGFPCVTYISFNVGRHKKDANTVKISCTRIRVPWFKIGKFTESKTLMNNLCLYTNNSWLVEKVLSWDPSLYRCLKTRNMKTSSRNAKSPYYHSFNTKFRTSYIIFFVISFKSELISSKWSTKLEYYHPPLGLCWLQLKFSS